MSLVDRSRSLSRLLGRGVEQLGDLLQTEVQLAQAELSEKVSDIGRGVTYLAATAIFLIPVITLLLLALALWLRDATGMSLALSMLISALLGAVIGAICAFSGMKYLRPNNLKPSVTLQQIKRDIAAAKDIAT
ncbi:phage holin family protein [Taklimakanibacter deserti]|uniref:phage holin family protein n=1 Tax=Taklimakanibacter deserti TaxID=2267839 RepID=UPI000E645FE5